MNIKYGFQVLFFFFGGIWEVDFSVLDQVWPGAISDGAGQRGRPQPAGMSTSSWYVVGIYPHSNTTPPEYRQPL